MQRHTLFSFPSQSVCGCLFFTPFLGHSTGEREKGKLYPLVFCFSSLLIHWHTLEKISIIDGSLTVTQLGDLQFILRGEKEEEEEEEEEEGRRRSREKRREEDKREEERGQETAARKRQVKENEAAKSGKKWTRCSFIRMISDQEPGGELLLLERGGCCCCCGCCELVYRQLLFL